MDLTDTFLAVNCTTPPQRPIFGTWKWSGESHYNSHINYTCGPYANFLAPKGHKISVVESVCMWNKTWLPSSLPPCVYHACPEIPLPPTKSGLQFVPEASSNFSLRSPHHQHSPSLPLTLDLPGTLPPYLSPWTPQVHSVIARGRSSWWASYLQTVRGWR